MELVIDTSGMRKRTALLAGRNNSPNELTSDPYYNSVNWNVSAKYSKVNLHPHLSS